MDEDLRKYEDSIMKKHSFSWTPHYEEEVQTSLDKIVFVPVVIKIFEKLEWSLIYQDESNAEAKRQGDWGNWTEKISVTYEFGKVTVKSVNLGDGFWDQGRNSKRVKLFIYVLQQTEKEYDRETLVLLGEEIKKKNNLDDYVLPETLPEPLKRKEPRLWSVIAGGMISALIIGYIVAAISVKGFYIIGLFESLVGLIFGFSLKYLIQFSNYTKYQHLHFVLIGMVISAYVSNQYFQYQIILNENNFAPISFFQFMGMRIEAGLTIKTMNTGSIGLIISWVLQLGLTYLIGVQRLGSVLLNYMMNRVPTVVLDFAIYFFVKKKNEEQVRRELAKMGWKNKDDQDDVFDAIGAMQNAREISRAT